MSPTENGHHRSTLCRYGWLMRMCKNARLVCEMMNASFVSSDEADRGTGGNCGAARSFPHQHFHPRSSTLPFRLCCSHCYLHCASHSRCLHPRGYSVVCNLFDLGWPDVLVFAKGPQRWDFPNAQACVFAAAADLALTKEMKVWNQQSDGPSLYPYPLSSSALFLSESYYRSF